MTRRVAALRAGIVPHPGGRHAIVRFSRPRISLLVDLRVVAVSAALTVVAALAFAGELAYGEFPLSLRQVAITLAGGGTSGDEFIVLTLRLPRALTALLVGGALAVSGTIFQTLVRNPLASPDILGITQGASCAAVTVIILGGAATLVPLAAFLGSVVTAILLYVLAWRSGVSPYRFVLVGIGIAAILAAGTQYMLTRGELYDVQRALVWLVGSLNGRSWEEVRPLAAALVVLIPAALLLASRLDALSLGEDTAKALGVDVNRARLALIVVGSALAAVAVAAAGPIGFVALIAPLIARRLADATGGAVLPVSMLTGAVLVCGSDLIGRWLLAPRELPVGIVTSILGAPFFLYLLYRANRTGAGA
jgi:iron complex transport system permease protein